MAQEDTDRVRTLRIIFQGELKDKKKRDKCYHNTEAQLDRFERLIKHYDLKLPVDNQASRTPTAKELRRIVMRCVQNSYLHSGSHAFQLDPAITLSNEMRKKYLQPLGIKIPQRLTPKPAKEGKEVPEQHTPPSGEESAESELSHYSTAHQSEPSVQQAESPVPFAKVSDSHSHHGEVLENQPSVSVQDWLQTTGPIEIPESARPTPSPLTSVNSETRLPREANDATPKRNAATAFDDEVQREGEESKRQKVGSFVLKLGAHNQQSRTTSPLREAGGLAARESNNREQVQALKDNELQVPAADDAGKEAVQQSEIAEHLGGNQQSQVDQQRYPYGLRGVDDVASRVEGLVQLMIIASSDVIEDLALDDVQAQFVPDPKPDLEALYKRTMCKDDESWKTSASQLGLQGVKLKLLLTMCIGAAVYDEVFCKELPWKTSREVLAQAEISGRLESLAQLLPGLNASGPYANAAYLIYQSGADMLQEGSVFDQKTVALEAQSLAETFLLTIQAQLKCCKSKLKVPGDFSGKTTDALAKIFRKALLLRGGLEEAPHDFEYTWTPSMAPFVEKDMTEVRSLEGVESVVGAIFPGIWRRDEQGELHLVSRLKVYGRIAAKKHSASKA